MDADTGESRGRPFESLDWYRAAVRAERQEGGSADRLRSWLTGLGFLTVHVSVFAVGIVALVAVNLLRSPQDLWADRAGAAWALLLTIHAVAIGLVWAVRLLGKEEPAALQVIPDAEWRRPASWPVTKADAPAPQAHPPVTSATQTSGAPSSAPDAPPAPTVASPGPPPGWSSWGQSQTQTTPTVATTEPKPSWKEAATWLIRRRGGTAQPPPASPRPSPPADGDHRPPAGPPAQ